MSKLSFVCGYIHYIFHCLQSSTSANTHRSHHPERCHLLETFILSAGMNTVHIEGFVWSDFFLVFKMAKLILFQNHPQNKLKFLDFSRLSSPICVWKSSTKDSSKCAVEIGAPFYIFQNLPQKFLKKKLWRHGTGKGCSVNMLSRGCFEYIDPTTWRLWCSVNMLSRGCFEYVVEKHFSKSSTEDFPKFCCFKTPCQKIFFKIFHRRFSQKGCFQEGSIKVFQNLPQKIFTKTSQFSMFGWLWFWQHALVRCFWDTSLAGGLCRGKNKSGKTQYFPCVDP
jgi:hypothetical protein